MDRDPQDVFLSPPASRCTSLHCRCDRDLFELVPGLNEYDRYLLLVGGAVLLWLILLTSVFCVAMCVAGGQRGSVQGEESQDG